MAKVREVSTKHFYCFFSATPTSFEILHNRTDVWGVVLQYGELQLLRNYVDVREMKFVLNARWKGK